MPRFGLLSFTLAALTTSALAEERVPSFVDMRLNAQWVTSGYKADGSSLTHDISGRLGVSWTGSLGIQRWGGVVWGLGGTWGYGKDENADNIGQAGTNDYTIQTGTLDLFIGYAYAFRESLQIEIMPVVGLGKAWLRNSNGLSDADAYIEYGLRGNLTWTMNSGLQFGVVSDFLLAPDNNLSSNVSGRPGGDFDNTRFAVGAFIGVRL